MTVSSSQIITIPKSKNTHTHTAISPPKSTSKPEDYAKIPTRYQDTGHLLRLQNDNVLCSASGGASERLSIWDFYHFSWAGFCLGSRVEACFQYHFMQIHFSSFDHFWSILILHSEIVGPQRNSSPAHGFAWNSLRSFLKHSSSLRKAVGKNTPISQMICSDLPSFLQVLYLTTQNIGLRHFPAASVWSESQVAATWHRIVQTFCTKPVAIQPE